MNKRTYHLIYAVLLGIIMAVLEILNPKILENPIANRLLLISLTRIIGGTALWLFSSYMNVKLLWIKKFNFKGLIHIIPCILIAVNNIPIISLIMGHSEVTNYSLLPLYILSSFSIAYFEEIAFRGIVAFLVFTYNYKKDRKVVYKAAVCAIVFGLIHLVNLLYGAGFGATIMQVGYSFLIGGMCLYVLLETHSLIPCIFIHGIYDFGGSLIEYLGSGELWYSTTIIETTILSVVVACYVIFKVLKMKNYEVNDLFRG